MFLYVHGAQINTINQYLATSWVIKSLEKSNDGALTTTGSTDQSDSFSSRYHEIQTIQNTMQWPRRIVKMDITKFHTCLCVVRLDAALCIGNDRRATCSRRERLAIKQTEHLVAGS